jgi:hypothetical protein
MPSGRGPGGFGAFILRWIDTAASLAAAGAGDAGAGGFFRPPFLASIAQFDESPKKYIARFSTSLRGRVAHPHP